MKESLMILAILIASVILAWALFFFSLFLSWGRIIEPGTGMVFAAVTGFFFFVVATANVVKKSNDPNPSSLREKKGVRLLLFLLPVLIILFYILPKFHDWYGTSSALYRYHGFPCENTTFETQKKMMLIYHNDVSIPQSAYAVTHHALEFYNKKLEKSSNLLRIVPKGTAFKVIGFYHPFSRHVYHKQYYLVQSMDSNQTKAWLYRYSFHSKTCRPERMRYGDKDAFSAKRGTYREEKIDLSRLKMAPYVNARNISGQK